MEIIETIARIRNLYVIEYMEAVVMARHASPRLASEVLIELNSPSRTGVFRLFRIDMISGPTEDPKLSEFYSDTYLHFEPIEINFGQLAVQIRPFHWYSANLRCHSIHSPQSSLESWGEKWLDINDQRKRNGDGSFGVIHSIGESVLDGRVWSTVIDFGTAPPDAFWDCLGALEATGAKTITVETPGISENNSTE